MKAISAFFLGIIHLAGCSVGKPPLSDVEFVEELTKQNACVGSLGRWHREFSYQKRGNRIDRSMIDIAYTEAGHRALPAGRFITEPAASLMEIDDAQFRFAGGMFDRESRKIVAWKCGCNFPPYDVSYQIECAPINAPSAKP